MQTPIHGWLAVPAAAVFFGVVLTLQAPSTSEWMPPVILFVFHFAMVAVTIAQSVGAMTGFHARRSPLQARAVRVPRRSETRRR